MLALRALLPGLFGHSAGSPSAGLPHLLSSLQSPLVRSFLSATNSSERRESLPLPLSFVAWLERQVMLAATPAYDVLVQARLNRLRHRLICLWVRFLPHLLRRWLKKRLLWIPYCSRARLYRACVCGLSFFCVAPSVGSDLDHPAPSDVPAPPPLPVPALPCVLYKRRSNASCCDRL